MQGPEVGTVEIFAPGGERVWAGHADTPSGKLTLSVPEPEVAALVARLAIGAGEGHPVARSAVIGEAERLGCLSRTGNVKGFVTVLPRAALLDSAVQSFIQPTLARQRAVRIDFPGVFDSGPGDIQELTRSYECQGRMFVVADDDNSLRLSYAADPGLFAWLRGRRLDRAALPYAVFSPLEGFRRFQSGEIAGVDILRQYSIPDFHILCAPDHAQDAYLAHLTACSEDLCFFFGERFVAFHDVWADALGDHKSLGARTAAEAQVWTVVRWKTGRPRYYGVKSGLIIQAGFADMRLVTLQWDDTNAARFDIATDAGERPIIIHATLIAGWPKMLPLLIGRGLAELGPCEIPVELSDFSLVFVPVADRHVAHIERIRADLCARGMRSTVAPPDGRPIGQRLGALRAQWRPAACVIGDREADGAEPRVVRLSRREETLLYDFVDEELPRITRCRPAQGLLNGALPFQEGGQ